MATSLHVARPVQTLLSARNRTSQRSLNHRPFVLPVALLAGTLLSAELASPQAGGIVNGIVTAANRMPIPEAHVRFVGTNLATVTRVDGVFQVAQVPAGPHTIEITMIGYTPKTVAIVVPAGETLNVSFALEPLLLETVTVTADENFFAGRGGFQERKARGTGRYFTHAEIKLMQPRQVTDVLRRVPGMQIQFGGASFGGGTQTARAGRSAAGSGSRPCVMNYFLNGSPFPLPSDASINQYVATDDLAAVEVYTGSSQIPAEFNSSMYGSRCGVVAIWTRSSLDAKASH